MSRESIRAYFEKTAPRWDHWMRKSRYYHGYVYDRIQGMVPPGKAVLVYGAGTGDLLDRVKPGRGVGLNVAEELTRLAREKYPGHEFITVDVDEIRIPEGFHADYVIMHNMLDLVYDIWAVLEHLRPALHEHSVIIVTTSNPLWSPLLKLGSMVGQRTPNSPRNYITNKDISSVLRLQGLDVVEEGMLLPVPRYVPLVSAFLNALVPHVPVLRYTGSTQYIVARPRVQRRPPKVSVIIPCHDEEDNIAQAIRRTPDMYAGTEVIVVNDGSRDRTVDAVKEVMTSDPRVRLVSTQRNQGKASAVKAGMDAATGDVVVILDADMTVMPEELPKFIHSLYQGTADFVNGTRLVYPMDKGAMSYRNYLGNKAFCFLASFIMRQRVSDTLCGTKAFFKGDYLHMPLQGRERWGDFDFLYSAARLKLRILEIPIHYQERVAGVSKMHVLRDGFLFLRASLQGWRLINSPRKYPLPARREPIRGWEEIRQEAD